MDLQKFQSVGLAYQILTALDWHFDSSMIRQKGGDAYYGYRPITGFKHILNELQKADIIDARGKERLRNIAQELLSNEHTYIQQLLENTRYILSQSEFKCDIGAENQLDPFEKIMIDIGFDLYHSMGHNLVTAIVAGYILLNSDLHLQKSSVEALLISAVLHDSSKVSDEKIQFAQWEDSSVVTIIERFYPNAKSEMLRSVMLNLKHTYYSNPGGSVFVSYSESGIGAKADWDKMGEISSVLVASDWLAQTLAISKQSRQNKAGFLYSLWHKWKEIDAFNEFPINLQVLNISLQCLERYWFAFENNKVFINNLDELLGYYADSKTQLKSVRQQIHSRDLSPEAKIRIMLENTGSKRG